MVGMRFAERPELVRRAAVLEAAARVHVGQHHDLFGAEDLGRIGHELHAAEGDDIGIGFGGLLAQFQTVADEIGKVLNIGGLVVMRENDRVLLLAEAIDLGEQVLAGRQVGLCGHMGSRMLRLWRL